MFGPSKAFYRYKLIHMYTCTVVKLTACKNIRLAIFPYLQSSWLPFAGDFSVILFCSRDKQLTYSKYDKRQIYLRDSEPLVILSINRHRPYGSSRTLATVVRVIWLSSVNVENIKNTSYWTVKSMMAGLYIFNHVLRLCLITPLERAIQTLTS